LVRWIVPGPFAARLAYLAGRLVKRDPANADVDGTWMTATSARTASPRSSAASAPDVRMAVIGAGPHGLSMAAHAHDAEVSVFGEPMEFWRTRMPTGMMLRSAPRASSIGHPSRTLTIERWGEAE